MGLAQSGKQPRIRPIGVRECQVGEQTRHAIVARAEALATRSIAESAANHDLPTRVRDVGVSRRGRFG